MLTNSGTETLTITSIAISGDFLQTNTCGATVAIGAELHDQRDVCAHDARAADWYDYYYRQRYTPDPDCKPNG